MNKRYIAAAMAVMTILAGCGQVEEKETAPAAAAENGNEVTEESCTSEYPTDDETISEEEVTAEEQSILGEEYLAEIFGDGFFGFELFNDGHISQSWDNRMEAAPVLLEAMAQTDEENTVDLAISMDELNRRETEGFLTYIKFEEAKPFRLGDSIMEGYGVTAEGDENGYYFWVEYEDGSSSPCYEMDKSYADRMTAAAMGEGGEAAQVITGSTELPAKYDEMIVASYMGEIVHDMDTDRICEIALEALNDRETAQHTLDQPITEEYVEKCLEDGLDVEITMTIGLDEALNIFTTDTGDLKVRTIQICGREGSYSMAVDNAAEMIIDPSYGERIITEGLNR
ncbi:hypothetical protein [Ruminococcus sp.]|uniref:hypothetical protein n=1 Tax=Ruminococcus sp. TaxID=41978 RepID=UPI0025F4C558|nr:hypothetical protein [Ruminococcus sp.]MBQ8967978.1 hypothetical protein [Ruminococcus sp.]